MQFRLSQHRKIGAAFGGYEQRVHILGFVAINIVYLERPVNEQAVWTSEVSEAVQWCPFTSSVSPGVLGQGTGGTVTGMLEFHWDFSPELQPKRWNRTVPMSSAFAEYSSLLLIKGKKIKGEEKKESLTLSVASQTGGKGQDKWILSRSLACGAHSLYRPAKALLGEVINVFQLEQGAHCWSLDPLLGWQWKIPILVKQPPSRLEGLLSIHL